MRDVSPGVAQRARITAALPGAEILADQEDQIVGWRYTPSEGSVRERWWVLLPGEDLEQSWNLLADSAEKLAKLIGARA